MKDDPRNLRGTFYECCCDLAVEIQMGSKRMDIRERVAALAMLRQYLSSWDEPDESDRGTAVRKYEGAFEKAASGARHTANARPTFTGSGLTPQHDPDANGGDTSTGTA